MKVELTVEETGWLIRFLATDAVVRGGYMDNKDLRLSIADKLIDAKTAFFNSAEWVGSRDEPIHDRCGMPLTILENQPFPGQTVCGYCRTILTPEELEQFHKAEAQAIEKKNYVTSSLNEVDDED